MNVHESITQSLDNLTKRKLRSLLTMLGIIFGVGAVISMRNLQSLDGAFFDHEDEALYNQVCVLGASAKQGLFGFESALGKTVKINSAWFSVVGVIADQTLSQDEFQGVKLQNTNNDIYI